MGESSGAKRVSFLVVAGLVGLAGCSDPEVVSAGMTTSPEAEPGSTGGDPLPAGSESDAADDESSSGSTGEPEGMESSSSGGAPAVCGNGIVEGDEDCDDDSVGCRSDCRSACGLATTHVGGDSEIFSDVALHPDGHLLAFGQMLSEDDAASTIRLTSLTAEGEVLDENDLPLGETSGTYGISVLPDGSVYGIAGADAGGAYFSMLVMHWDAAGTHRWNEQAEWPFHWQTRPSVALSANGTVTVVTDRPTDDTGRDLWVGEYDADGLSTSRTYDSSPEGGAVNDFGGLVNVGTDGTVTVGGLRTSPQGGPTVSDPFVARLGETAEDPAAWSWSEYLESSNLQLTAIDARAAGDGRTIWLFQQRHDFDTSAHYLLVALEPDGAVAWRLDSREIGEDARRGEAMVVDDAGRVFVIGRNYAPDGGGQINAQRVTAWDRDGETLCDVDVEDLGFFSGGALSIDGRPTFVGRTQGYELVDLHPVFTALNGFED
ncbi:MAG: hypothetical protein AAF721_22330 [Myxococcota bacterium]